MPRSTCGLIIALGKMTNRANTRVQIANLFEQVALLSARLSPSAVQHLLSETHAAVVITSPRLSNTVSHAISQIVTSSPSCNAPVVYLQRSYEDDLQRDSQDFPHGPLCDQNHFIDENDRNVLILHSSGTTGLPKPVYQSHRYFLGYAACHQRSDHEDVGGLNLSTLPLYHVGLVFDPQHRFALRICY